MKQYIIFMTILLLLGIPATASTACPSPQTFGDNCEYQCHCDRGRACGIDGSCSNQCASIWDGEYCQRGNVAGGRSSNTSQSSTSGSHFSSLALDGNTNQAFSSCSHTTIEDKPWWQVDLGKKYVLFTVKIWISNEGDVRECKTTQKGTEYTGTMNTTRKGFTCADWLDETIHSHNFKPAINSSNYCRNLDPLYDVEPWCYTTDKAKHWDYCNVPWCLSKLKNFKVWMDSNICHQNTGVVRLGASPEYQCDTPVVGRYMKLQLMDSSTVLTLCEVAVQAFQYRECHTNHYGPNCNNRCQCANDITCDDKTGKCPTGLCNDRFTGPYCNIEIPTVLKNATSTPTSISVKWMYNRPHDSAYDAGEVAVLHIRYNSTADTSSGYRVSSPSPGLLSADLTSLQPSTQYSVRTQVQYRTSKGGSVNSPLGRITNIQTESCEGYMVMPVITVTSNRIVAGSAWPNRVSLGIKTEIPQVPGMIIECNKQLKVYIKKTTDPSYVEIIKTGQTFSMNRLTAFTEYNFKATVRSPDGKQKDNIRTIKTAEDVPSAPTIDKAGASPTSISIRLTPPDQPYGVITHYRIEMWEEGSRGKTFSFGPYNLTHTLNELTFNTTYHFKAKASTSAGFGTWSNEISIITVENIPGPPNTLLAQDHTTNSLVLVWTKPKYPNGILTNYKVICTPLYSYDENVNAKRTNYAKESNPHHSVTQLMITGLTPATEYNCSVSAQTAKGYGPSVWLRNWTKPEALEVPGSLFPNISQDKTSDATITVVIKKMPKFLKAGSTKSIRIGVEKIAKLRRRRSIPIRSQADRHASLTDYETAKANNHSGYIAAELDSTFTGAFVIGDGKTYGGYYNPSLLTGQKYDVIFGMVFSAGGVSSFAYRRYGKPITVGRISSPAVSSVAGLAVGLTIGILVILAVTIIPVAVIFIRRRRAAEQRTYEQPMPMKDASRNKDDNVYDELDTRALHDQTTYYNITQTNETPLYENIEAGGREGPHGNMAIVHNEDYENPCLDISEKNMLVLALVSEIQEKHLEQEFKAIPYATSTIDQTSAEPKKGPGSMDIIPFEFNQVKISDGKGNINACFIKAKDKAIAYIAAKDPETGMANEMWEMIWQNQCTAVVMLTTPSEDKDKGYMYWHSEGSAIYTEIKVTVLEEEEAEGCIRRTFKLSKGSQFQLALHMQLLKWPRDSRRSRILLDMLRSVSRHSSAGPIFVHCGDGSDRTGTVIALDTLIKEVESADEDLSYRRVNVVDCVKILREQRPGMVSSLSNYKFIHDALVEHFLVGRTAIKRANFMEDFVKLNNLLPYRDSSRMEELLQFLAYFTPPISSFNFSEANAGVNKKKNRDRYILADDDHRVKLVSSNGKDYINAVYVQGYQKPPYIVTQMPLPNTIGDFWKLVHDESVTTIVMLNQDNEKEASGVYWPKKGQVQEHETFSVKCIETNSHPEVAMRDFKFVSDKLWKKETIVRQFQLLNWLEDAMVPSNPSSIVQLVNMVNVWHSTNPKAKILVHCRNGAERSGAFCVAHAAIAQMKSENEADIFNLTRDVIACRPQFSDCWQLLEFVHEVVGEFLSIEI